MSRKYTLNDLVRWGHIADYEAKKLIKYGFTDVDYENRISTIKNTNKNINYQFNTSSSRNGYMRYELVQIKPYKHISPTGKYNRSLWQIIKLYEKEIEVENEKNEKLNLVLSLIEKYEYEQKLNSLKGGNDNE